MSSERDYVLGTHAAELERLGLQHRVWRPRVSDAWQRAGFASGQTLLDIGCGPGYASLDLAEIVGPGGRVIAMDRSRRFLDALSAAAAARGIANVEVRELDLDEGSLPARNADGAWSRWVYAFVSRPRQLLENVHAALRPGGVAVMYEYVDYRSWRLSPRSQHFEDFVREVIASWRETGGEPDVGLDLPRWCVELGFEVLELRPISVAARPGDHFWEWPRAFVETGIQRLVDLGRLDEARARAMREAYHALETTPGGFTLTPTVLEVIARKR
jgi:SAM-dependent methyltransferase